MRHYEIGIIGAGAAGMMAAIVAAKMRPGCSIVLAERNPDPGRKLLATGNGRCNYLNAGAGADSYYFDEDAAGGLAARNLAASLFQRVSVSDLMDMFRELGIEPRQEEEGRLYPRSNQAASIEKALARGLHRAGAELLAPFWVRKVERQNGGFVVTSDDDRSFICNQLIITTGGKAGIQYGSSGDGYKFAMDMGCTGVKPVPALTPFVCTQEMDKLFGVRVQARISIVRLEGGKTDTLGSDSGELQFTKEGLSGICTFNISRFYRIAEGRSHEAHIDLFEEYTQEALLALLTRRRNDFAEERADVLFQGLLPEKLGAYLLTLVGAGDGRTLLSSLTDAQLSQLAGLAKDLTFNIIGTGSWRDSQVTAGGLHLSQCTENLEVKSVPGLYLAGEILDADGPCGGYNLTWAFLTGCIAGQSAAQSVQ